MFFLMNLFIYIYISFSKPFLGFLSEPLQIKISNIVRYKEATWNHLCVYMLMYNVCVCVFNYTDPQMCRGQQGIDRWGCCLAGGRTSSRTVNVRSRRRRRSLWTADTNTETHSGEQIIFIQSIHNYMANIYHLSEDDKDSERENKKKYHTQ